VRSEDFDALEDAPLKNMPKVAERTPAEADAAS